MTLDTDRNEEGPRNSFSLFDKATADLDPPFALIDLDAFWDNAVDLERRARGKPIRLASKSVRCRPLQRQVLDRSGFRGTLAFTLGEALWLAACGFDDLVVAYPTADRSAIAQLAKGPQEDTGSSVTLMVDSVEQLDLIESAAPGRSGPISVCIDVDAGWWVLGGRLRIGAKRSPLHGVEDAVALAREISSRRRFRLRGLMAYEAQIAGVGDAPPGRRLRGAAIRAMQAASAKELAERRAEVVESVRAIVPLEFVNAGGTGSIDTSAAEHSVTEVSAGSGLFGPVLFSSYQGFKPQPAAFFALPVVRKPSTAVATVLGGGYLASGPGDKTRLPKPHFPPGLELDRQEGAGEVQTPVLGDAAAGLSVGDRVYFRHAKAGEMCERFNTLLLVRDGVVIDEAPTYRGEGRCFL